MKQAVAGAGATAALAAIALNYQAPEGTQLFQLFGERHTMDAVDYEFINYISAFGKSYNTRSEYEFRREQYLETLRKIEEHNANPLHKSTVGINFMADWSHSEYKRLLGYKGP